MLIRRSLPCQTFVAFLTDDKIEAPGDARTLAQDSLNFLIKEIMKRAQVAYLNARPLRVQYRIAPDGRHVNLKPFRIDQLIRNSALIQNFFYGRDKTSAQLYQFHARV